MNKAIGRMNIDGLKSLTYKRIGLKMLKTHTLITVDVNEKDITQAVFGRS